MALDDVTEDAIEYVSHRRLRYDSGQMGVITTLRNIDDDFDIVIDWRIIFYDRYRFRVEETEWNNVVVPSRQEIEVRGNSIGTEAVDFLIQVRGSAT